jgi:hypothetical protein
LISSWVAGFFCWQPKKNLTRAKKSAIAMTEEFLLLMIHQMMALTALSVVPAVGMNACQSFGVLF